VYEFVCIVTIVSIARIGKCKTRNRALSFVTNKYFPERFGNFFSELKKTAEIGVI
jgi:hypothetical protein